MANAFFRVEMLPARHGDCLWIEYGKGAKVHRVLIDGGPVSTFTYIDQRLAQVPAGQRAFDLIVLTHVDADHVEGLVRLFAEKPLPFNVDEVWFNGWRQMEQAHGLLGPAQGEFLSALLTRRVPNAWKASAKPWVVLKDKPLPTFTLEGGMKLTLLSPDPPALNKMAKAWKAAIKTKGFDPGDLDAAWDVLARTKKFLPKKGLLGTTPNLDALLKKQFAIDEAPANGSSIAFLAEFGKKSVLFLADAHPDIVEESVRRLCADRGIDRLTVDAVKVAHHGSKHNTSPALLKLLKSPCFLVSSNGDQFKHPDQDCIARILKHGEPKRLYFNYRTKFNKPWLSDQAQQQYHYEAVTRADDAISLVIDI